MLEVGMKAPDFTLMNQLGVNVSLSDFAGKKVVLYFYPKDNTPGCTRQACAFALNYNNFEEKGVIIIEREGVEEDKLMEDAIECGAIDFITDEEEIFEIRTDANDLGAVTAALEEKGYKFVSSETAYIPQTYTRIDDQDNMKGMSKMLDMFDDNDDIQDVWHNWENEDEYEG